MIRIKPKHLRAALTFLVLITGVMAITFGFKTYRQGEALDAWYDRMSIAEQQVNLLQRKQEQDHHVISQLIEQRDESNSDD